MIRKLLGLFVALAALHALTTAGGGGQVVAAVLLWTAEGYIVWRAWPAMRDDVARLRPRLRRRNRTAF